jgi:hypothetical protein
MNTKNTRLHILQAEKDFSKEVKTGVSLHCHTQFSKEMLDFIPHYAEKMPIINYFWQRESAKWLEREGKELRSNFDTAYWSPPLSEKDVYSIEKEQIESLGVNPIVSITDHDNIEANLKICEHTPNEIAPVSLEWTVPFEYGFFHVGVHNLPKDTALEISQQLLDYTFSGDETPNNQRLHDLFAMLNEMPEVLVILNHPLWDIEMVGKERHEVLLDHFIKEHAKWIHAFEINGFRNWSENSGVIKIAESIGMPLCSGGDRHGCKPNTVINLTNAKSFAEFADEVRNDKRTQVVLMPEYSAPLHSRQLQSFSEILSYYEHFPEERRRWFDRIFFNVDGQGLRPLSSYGWKLGGPKWLRAAIKVLAFLGKPELRPFYKLVRKREDVVPKSVSNEKFLDSNQSVLTENDKLITDN